MKAAAVGAAITSLAGYPRLVLWNDRPHQLWFLSLTLAWASFILWSFVFGWRTQNAYRPILAVKASSALWSAATLAGLAGAMVLRLFIDSVLQPLVPGDYPDTYEAWL